MSKLSDDEIKQYIEQCYADREALKADPEAMAAEEEENAFWGLSLPKDHDQSVSGQETSKS